MGAAIQPPESGECQFRHSPYVVLSAITFFVLIAIVIECTAGAKRPVAILQNRQFCP